MGQRNISSQRSRKGVLVQGNWTPKDRQDLRGIGHVEGHDSQRLEERVGAAGGQEHARADVSLAVQVWEATSYAARRNETTGRCRRPPRNVTTSCGGPALVAAAATGA